MREKGFMYTVFLMSEISPVRIALFEDSVDAWIQIACPRLSIDWGNAFKKPILTPFEAEIALGDLPGWWEKSVGSCSGDGLCSDDGDYPMDCYAQDGGEWNSSYMKKPTRTLRRHVSSASGSNGAL